MNLLLPLLEVYTPGFVKGRALRELFRFTAAAFEDPAPLLNGRSHDERLLHYALYTQRKVEEVLRSAGACEGDETPQAVRALQERLYHSACRLGQRHGALLRLDTLDEVMAMGRILYRILGIDMQGDAQGDIIIRRCYFSQFYSGPVCRVMSAMDCGLFAGLSGGGQLVFASRITEGQPCCRARFALGEAGGSLATEGAA